MLSLIFLCPFEATLSINAPTAILKEAVKRRVQDEDGYEDEYVDRYKLVVEPECRSVIVHMMEWLESEGLWYIFCEGNKVLRSYLPGFTETLDPLGFNALEQNTAQRSAHP